VPIDHYAAVAARPAVPVVRADLQFRVSASGGWYSVQMVNKEGEWSTFFPRPTSAVREIEYRVVMTTSDTSVGATPAITVPVVNAGGCNVRMQTSLESPISIRVPEGAPAVPPVPAGFSPAGVVPPQERRFASRTKKIAGAAVGAAFIGGTAAAISGSAPVPRTDSLPVPGLRFNSISPSPGSSVSLNGESLVVNLVMEHEPPFPLAVTWVVELRSGELGRACLTMDGRLNVPQRPLDVPLTAPFALAPGGGCGTQFVVDSVRITLTYPGGPLYDETLALRYQFRP
jgi:hypothetical protein